MIAPAFPGPDPGLAEARLDGGRLTMQNAALSVSWNLSAPRWQLVAITDRIANRAAWPQAGEIFVLTLADGRTAQARRCRSSSSRPR